MSVDVPIDTGDDAVDSAVTRKRDAIPKDSPEIGKKDSEKRQHRTESVVGNYMPENFHNLTTPMSYNAVRTRDIPTDQSTFKLQDPSPNHLTWLSQLSRMARKTGQFLDFEKFLFDDSMGRQSQTPTVYIIDTGVNTHKVCYIVNFTYLISPSKSASRTSKTVLLRP
jgi:hypothetical protein